MSFLVYQNPPLDSIVLYPTTLPSFYYLRRPEDSIRSLSTAHHRIGLLCPKVLGEETVSFMRAGIHCVLFIFYCIPSIDHTQSISIFYDTWVGGWRDK